MRLMIYITAVLLFLECMPNMYPEGNRLCNFPKINEKMDSGQLSEDIIQRGFILLLYCTVQYVIL